MSPYKHTCIASALLIAAVWLATPATTAAPLMGAPFKLDSKAKAAVVSQLAARRFAVGLDADHGIKVVAEHPGVHGTHVVRAAHTYKGLRVFGSESVVVLDNAGAIVSEAASERRLHLGRGNANRLRPMTADFSVKPSIFSKAAIDAAVAATVAAGTPVATAEPATPPATPPATHLVPPTAELLIYPVMRIERTPGAADKLESELNAVDVVEVVDHYELAYLVRTRMQQNGRPLYFDTVVSAKDAHIIDRWSMVQSVIGIGKSQYNGEVPISTTLKDGSYSMLDPERGTGGAHGAMAITNANNSSSAGEMYTNATNTWGDGKQ